MPSRPRVEPTDDWHQIDLPAFATFVPDRDCLRASGVPLTVVVGEDYRDGWYGAAARWLVEGADAGLIELPGGHGGFQTHREEFVALVRRVGLGAASDAAARTRPLWRRWVDAWGSATSRTLS